MITNIVALISVVVVTNWQAMPVTYYPIDVRHCNECGGLVYYKPCHEYGFISTNTYATIVYEGKTNITLLHKEDNYIFAIDRWSTNRIPQSDTLHFDATLNAFNVTNIGVNQ